MNDPDAAFLLKEIVSGYSLVEVCGQTAYLKHYSDYDRSIIPEETQRIIRECVKRGLPTEKTALEVAYRNGSWTMQEEDALIKQRGFVESLILTQEKTVLPSQKKEQQKTIDKESSVLRKMENDKKDSIGRTAEDFANAKGYETFILSLLFSDKSLETPLFSKEEQEELTTEDIEELFRIFREVKDRISEVKLNELVVSTFFSPYLTIAEDPTVFFKKNVFDLSSFQVRLVGLAKTYTNIFKNYQIPDSIIHDYEKVLSFVKRENNKLKGKEDSHSMKSYVGGTKEDMEELEPNSDKVNLLSILKKKGGKMDIKDLSNL